MAVSNVSGRYFNCSGAYNITSCVVLGFLKASGGGSVAIAEFSRDTVLYIYENPPSWPSPKDVERYVEELYESAKAVFKNVAILRFTLRTPLTIHTKWPYLPLEIGLAIHPLLNVPYIPGSSLKGLLSHFIDKACGLDAVELFGDAEHKGMLVVFDAYPVKWDKVIEPDVITPHYREVEGEISEVEASPTPLVYPTVPPGVEFAFIVATDADVECTVELQQRIANALARGVGARTSLGYGRFKF